MLKYLTSLGAVKVKWTNKDGTRHDVAQEKWDLFQENPNMDGYGTLGNTQLVWNSSIFQTGNSYTRMLVSKGAEGTVPLKLQTIPSEMHDVLYNGESDRDNIRTGIKFVNNVPKTYYFREGLYNSLWNGSSFSSDLIKIKAEEIIHQFDRETPGQWLGIPKLASVLVSLYELDELRDATVSKQKAAQAIAWIVENTNPLSMTPTGSPIMAKDKDEKDKIVFKSSGGNTQYLNKGEKINFYQSTDIGTNLPVLISSELRRIASSLGMPYHSLTGDTSGLDFSSLRAIAIELRTRLEFIHQFRTIPLGLGQVTKRFKELGSLYFPIEDAIATYQLPRWYGVDDLKDSQANLLNLSMGTTTLQRLLDERHLTFEDILASRSMLEEVGLGHLMEGKTDASKQVTNNEANINSSE